MQLSPQAITTLQQTVLGYYEAHGRHELPWRQPDSDGRFDPYKIMVSEIMLQQTQVGRVMPKYQLFVERFPTVQVLARAPKLNNRYKSVPQMGHFLFDADF